MMTPLMMSWAWAGSPRMTTMLEIKMRINPPAVAPAMPPAPPASDTPPMTAAMIEFELVATPDPVVYGADVADQQKSAEFREHRTEDIADDRDAVGIQSDQFGRARVSADDINPPAERRLAEDHPENCEQQREQDQVDREPHNLPAPR